MGTGEENSTSERELFPLFFIPFFFLGFTHNPNFLGTRPRPSGSSIEERGPPIWIVRWFEVVAIWVTHHGLGVLQREEFVAPIHHLQLLKIGGFSVPFFGEMPAPHLGKRMFAHGVCVHDLPAEIHLARVVIEVSEQDRWPVPEKDVWFQ